MHAAMSTLNCPPIPSALRERVFLHEGMLHISEELRGNMALESFLSLARRQEVTQQVWHAVEDFDAVRISSGTGQAEAVNAVQGQAIQMLFNAFSLGASDIHVGYHATYGTIRLRRMGMLEEQGRVLGGEETITLIRAIYQSMTDAASPQFIGSERQEGRIVNREFLPPTVHSVRVHTEPLECASGEGTLMTLRLLYDKTAAEGPLLHRLEVLGYPAQERPRLAQLAQRTGLTLVAGPTGHGKSTLLKHVIEAQALEHPENSFLSIEDPPEYPLRRVNQVMVGSDNEFRGKAYQQAIAGAMRADPDVIMIGEVRFPEAASSAVDAALTGHTVWTSIHAGSAFGIMGRMRSLLTAAKFADPMEYLCDPSIIAGLIYQRLVPVLCPHCKISLTDAMRADSDTRKRCVEPVLPALQRLRRTGTPLDGVQLRGMGCGMCQHIGISGLTVAAEVVVTDTHLMHLLRKHNVEGAMAYWRHELGGKSSLARALQLIEKGQLDPGIAESRMGMLLDQEVERPKDISGVTQAQHAQARHIEAEQIATRVTQ